MTFTKAIITALAKDAAERSRRARNIDMMDEEAHDAYCDEFYRMVELIGGDEAWIDLPNK